MTQRGQQSMESRPGKTNRGGVRFKLIRKQDSWMLQAVDERALNVFAKAPHYSSTCSALFTDALGQRAVVGVTICEMGKLINLVDHEGGVSLLELVELALKHDLNHKNELVFDWVIDNYNKVGKWLLHYPGITVPKHVIQRLKH